MRFYLNRASSAEHALEFLQAGGFAWAWKATDEGVSRANSGLGYKLTLTRAIETAGSG